MILGALVAETTGIRRETGVEVTVETTETTSAVEDTMVAEEVAGEIATLELNGIEEPLKYISIT